MKTYSDIGIQIPQIYLPREGIDLSKWAVIACDQFTSQPEYWQAVEKYVGDAPSTLNLVLPEVYLDETANEERCRTIHSTMREYLDRGIIRPREGLIFVDRQVDGKSRKGIILCLDLEHYDYKPGSTSLIRATEGTIIERVHPRVKIRQEAVLELPHIMVLIDDPERTVVEPIDAEKNHLEKVYDFDLMLDSGHLTGYAVPEALEAQLVESLRKLVQPEAFAAKYGLGAESPVLLYAMGDGNHSLATAKTVWEKVKPQVGMDHPARYALVELENIHDEGLTFEPIHRALFGVQKDILAAMTAYFGPTLVSASAANAAEMVSAVNSASASENAFGLINGENGFVVLKIDDPSVNLVVGALQGFLKHFLAEGGARGIDYVHGEEATCDLGARRHNAGFYLPGVDKSAFFKTVIVDGALPLKTFSMGEAKEKRFYMEARKIV